MTKYHSKLDYSVHPDSLFYAGPADSYPLNDTSARPSSFMTNLMLAAARLFKRSKGTDAMRRPKRIDRYERT